MDDAVTVSLICIAVIAANALFVLYRWTPKALSPYLQLSCVSPLVFAFGNLMSNLTTSTDAHWYSLVLLYTGIYASCYCWWLVTMRIVRHQGGLANLSTHIWQTLPGVVIFAFWLSCITNPWHGLFATPNVGGRSDFGPLWWGSVWTVWLLTLITLSTALYKMWNAKYMEDRWQLGFCALAMIVPPLFNITYVLADTAPSLDPTAIGFAVSTSLIVVAVFRGQVYGVTSVRLEDAVAAGIRPGFLVDRYGRLIHANDGARNFMQLPAERVPLAPYLAEELLREDGRPATERDLDRRTALFMRRKNPDEWISLRKFDIHLSGSQVGHLMVIDDETDRVQLDKTLQEAQKFESLGLIAGGIAHDFNNLLVNVVGNAELAQASLPDDPDGAKELLARIHKAGQQGAQLAQQLLTYAGKAEVELAAVDVNDLARNVVEMLSSSVRGEVEITFDLDPDCGAAKADSAQLSQITLNLLVNAIEALPRAGGQIAIGTETVKLTAEELSSLIATEGARPGRFVALSVSDDGPGMDPETTAKMFDPFFSTKSMGRGLGLAASLGTVRSHRGGLRVRSAPDEGTSITVYLPAAASPAEPQRQGMADLSAWRGATVLLIEDNPDVSKVHTHMLQRLGFIVRAAADGESGITQVDDALFVVSDVTLPGVSGTVVQDRLKVSHPNVPVLLVSGYSGSFLDEHERNILRKPFSIGVLAETIQQVLNDSHRQNSSSAVS